MHGIDVMRKGAGRRISEKTVGPFALANSQNAEDSLGLRVRNTRVCKTRILIQKATFCHVTNKETPDV